jgi:glutamyl-tRNA synthetase
MVTAAPMHPRVRFAPSPSGYLHIGGARTALFNWLWAKSQGGTFVLRVEDTDQERSSIESVRAILDAMRWLGMDWDEGPEVGGDHGPYFQSERRQLYREAAHRLVEAGQAYRCYATEAELEQARVEHNAKHPKDPFVYPGWWRDRTDWPSDRPYVIRFKTPREGSTDFVDQVLGKVSTPNSSLYDFVLLRSDGYPLYNFAVVVDDHEMGITLVARGKDHVGNTPQQILIYRALGWDPPAFAHLPMMLSPQGEKLSKRHAAVGVQDYRDRGYGPMGVLNYLVRFGWSHGDQEIFSRAELVDLFSWEKVGKGDGKFDEKKFLDTNFEHLKQERLTSLEDYAAQTRGFLARRGLQEVDEATLRAAIPLVRERAHTFEEAALHLDYFFRPVPEIEPDARKKALVPAAAPHLRALRDLYANVSDFRPAVLEAALREWVEASGIKMKDAAQPARAALTGRTWSPPLFDVMAVLGKEQVLARLVHGAEVAEGG